MLPPSEITRLLIDWSNGDRDALDKLFPLIERELHRLAHYYIQRHHPGNILQTTALINETYIRLVDQKDVRWQNRAHFFGISAQIMRRIILNYVRDKKRQKRGGGAIPVSLSGLVLISSEKSDRLIALDEALCRLELIDPRKCKVIELRYFGGLSVEETAEVLKVSKITVMRDWKMAKAWIAGEIENG
jgi:RNA polymerase sigma factor (TIGR02999 family)